MGFKFNLPAKLTFSLTLTSSHRRLPEPQQMIKSTTDVPECDIDIHWRKPRQSPITRIFYKSHGIPKKCDLHL